MPIPGDNEWCCDMPMVTDRSWRVQISQYGDGYQQRRMDGINALERQWSPSWTNRPQAMIQALDAFLAATNGDAFDFLAAGTSLRRVTCDEWSTTWESKNYQTGEMRMSLTATFKLFNGVTL